MDNKFNGGDKVYWKKNPTDVYTVTDGHLRHTDSMFRYKIANHEGHEHWVDESELYPYVTPKTKGE